LCSHRNSPSNRDNFIEAQHLIRRCQQGDTLARDETTARRRSLLGKTPPCAAGNAPLPLRDAALAALVGGVAHLLIATSVLEITRREGRLAGELLAVTGRDRELAMDALLVACASIHIIDRIITGDPEDIRELRAALPTTAHNKIARELLS